MVHEFVQTFNRSPVRTNNRLMIESVCTKCGASSLVSCADQSLERWEDGHVCESGRPDVSTQTDMRET
jgi:hypothetical protein